MSNKVKWAIGVFVLIFLFNGFFTKGMIAGTYVNRNYENDFPLGVPHVADTLIIYADNKFYSRYYGKGDYRLKYGLTGTRIQLNYDDNYGGDSFSTTISRSMFIGSPKIHLCKDFNQHYQKIE